MVPIILAICCWITSYWFEDTRLGNGAYMGWSMIWAGIPLLLVGGLLAASNLTEAEDSEETSTENNESDEVAQKSYNDLFFIPVWIWGIAFIAFGIYL